MKTLDEENLLSTDILKKWVVCIETCIDNANKITFHKGEKYQVTDWYDRLRHDGIIDKDSTFGSSHSSWVVQKKYFVTEKEYLINNMEKSDIIKIENLEDKTDERIFQNFADELSFLAFSKIDGSPIFKIINNSTNFMEILKRFEEEDQKFQPKIIFIQKLEDHVNSGHV